MTTTFTKSRKFAIHIFNCILCMTTLLCSASQCSEDEVTPQPEPDYKLVFLNNETEEDIYISYRDFSYILLTPAGALMENGISSMIKLAPHTQWEYKIVNKDYRASDYCQILVIKQSTFDSHTVQDIMINNIFDKRYIFKYTEIEGDRLEIDYDGSES